MKTDQRQGVMSKSVIKRLKAQQGDAAQNLDVQRAESKAASELDAEPWYYVETKLSAVVVIGSGKYRIEPHWTGMGDSDVIRSIMQLCAAAPALYDALQLPQKHVHVRHCDPHPMGQSELCKVASDALAGVTSDAKDNK